MAPSGLSTCVFRCDMLARALRASKVTSPVLTAAYFPGVPGEWLLVSRARKLEMLQLLHFFFFCPAHNNNEDNSVQKSNQVFWHEVCSSILRNSLSHCCQVGQILIRAGSHPGLA